jgi:outer membrane protein OmpU
MKKLLLAGTAIAGVAMLSQPAHADLKLDLQGYFRGYANYTDSNTSSQKAGTVANNKLTKFSFMRDNEVHFTGQTTLDNGLTVGVHNEIKLGNESQANGTTNFAAQQIDLFNLPGDDPTLTDETYAYVQGEWGRVNLGSEDGAAYLLQVAAPSADSNIDGLRVYIQGFDEASWVGNAAGTGLRGVAGIGGGTNVELGYDNADFRQSERLTYLTPKWNGFQAGASYAAVPGMQNPFGGTYGQPVNSNTGQFKDLWEAAARWDGEFSGFGISAGGGFAGASKQSSLTAVGALGSKDLETWDAGLNFTWQQFSLGGAYKWSNTGTTSVAGTGGNDARIWDVGLGWDNGPWHAGASYFDLDADPNAYGFGAGLGHNLTVRRETVGGGYTFGPGMTFRGSVALLQADDHFATSTTNVHPDQTQVTLGTDINF